MNRIAGVGIFVLGILLVALGVLKVLPGAAGPGGFAAFMGLVVFGLSFIKTQDAPPDSPPPLPWTERVTGAFYDPTHIFQNLRLHPRWLAGFLVIAICSAIYNVAFVTRLTPEVVSLAPIEKTIEGGFIPEDRAEQVREQTREAAKSPMARISGPMNETGGLLLFLLFIAAILMLGALIFGGRLTYWQALCVAVYSTLPPIVITRVISLILLYVKSPEEIEPIKGQRGLVRADLSILFSPGDHPYLYVLGSSIGLLTIYGLWLEATGLRYAGQKLSSSSAWAIALILWGIGLVLGLALAGLFPTFVT